jgi:hypothetical protein
MEFERLYKLLLCYSLLFIFSFYSCLGTEVLKIKDDTKSNVITASDIGGGALTRTDILLVIFVAVGVFLIIGLIIYACYAL